MRYASRGGNETRRRARRSSAVSAAGKICLRRRRFHRRLHRLPAATRRGASLRGGRDHEPDGVEAAKRSARRARSRRTRAICGPKIFREAAELVTVDVSFISVAKILPAVVACARADADFLILVKPQFELDRGDIGKGGIVRDPALHERAVERVKAAAIAAGLRVVGMAPSRLSGAGRESGVLSLRPARCDGSKVKCAREPGDSQSRNPFAAAAQ